MLARRCSASATILEIARPESFGSTGVTLTTQVRFSASSRETERSCFDESGSAIFSECRQLAAANLFFEMSTSASRRGSLFDLGGHV
jgi:hypothetical protein